MKDIVTELFSFIEQSPTSFHAVRTMKDTLLKAGYAQLSEGDDWDLKRGGKYFVIRNGSALMAFRLPSVPPTGFQIMASHGDSPLFKIKENPEMEAEGHYVKLNIEKYGGMLCAPWFDRPLSCAGRLIVRTENGVESRLVDARKPLFVIPNLAIHMNREANDGCKFNVQKDMLPLYGDETAKGSFMAQMAALAGVDEAAVLGHDLYVYSCQAGTIWGAHDEFLSAGRLDDLECAFASLKGFLASDTLLGDSGAGVLSDASDAEVQTADRKTASIPVHCVFDNEEVGSGTRQGAASTFLKDTLERIAESLPTAFSDDFENGAASYRRLIANSFMVSADNAHAVHPNYGEKTCPTNRPYLNGGVVIKYSANQKYTTDGVSASVFKAMCCQAEVPFQIFHNRSDMPGGSTLGNISATQVPINTVDIGLPQLAMHSPYETVGVRDIAGLIKAATYFYRCAVTETADGVWSIGKA